MKDELSEHIEQENNSVFQIKDLVEIVLTEQENRWSTPLTASELLDEMETWEKNSKI